MKKIALFIISSLILSSCALVALNQFWNYQYEFAKDDRRKQALGAYKIETETLLFTIEIEKYENNFKSTQGTGKLKILDLANNIEYQFDANFVAVARGRSHYIDIKEQGQDSTIAYFKIAFYQGDSIQLINEKYQCTTYKDMELKFENLKKSIAKYEKLLLETPDEEEDMTTLRKYSNLKNEFFALEARLKDKNEYCFNSALMNKIPYQLVFKKHYSYRIIENEDTLPPRAK